ncbi:hypothetical protein DPMN_019416 [Dreissena polymorpha]|uniref:B box-type domain-containing protein n=1 Tax=Dreissena polymorpha TaxID=45954 RepID=A0A9D4NJ82_DREPO|nr:hypothetical protein DPMN_019416 [Dreissena polymorpha]
MKHRTCGRGDIKKWPVSKEDASLLLKGGDFLSNTEDDFLSKEEGDFLSNKEDDFLSKEEGNFLSKELEDFLWKCDVHVDKKLSQFCHDHSQLCCSDCVVKIHRYLTHLFF